MVDKPIPQKMIDEFSAYLRDKGFIEYQGFIGSYQGMGRINTKGIDHLANLNNPAVQHGDIPSVIFNNYEQKGLFNFFKTINKILPK